MSTEKQKKRKFVQLSESDVEKTDMWLLDGKRMVPYSKLSDEQLKDAIIEAEAKELKHHNRSSFFGIIAEKLITEAESRNLEVEHYNTEFTVKSHDKS